MDIFDADPANAAPAVRAKAHRVAVLVCAEASLASLGLIVDVFRMGNQVGGGHRFELLRVSEDGAAVPHPDGLLTVDAPPSCLADMDLVVVPSMWTLGPQAVARHPQLVAALRQLPARVLLVSMCSGAYMLAASGRLSGRRATTHWLLGAGLQARYPDVQVDVDANLVRDGQLLCSGGSLAGVDACLLAVELLSDRAMARALANLLVTDMRRGPQTRFMPAQRARAHADKSVQRLQSELEARCHEVWRLEDMADLIHVSPRTLQRRFVAVVGLTPLQFLQTVRIDKSKLLLETERLPVPEIAALVGYQDRVAFGRLFKKMVGMTPAAYRQRQS